MSVEVQFEDSGLKALWKNLGELDGLEIELGFIGRDGAMRHPLARVSMATIAMYNEFGTIDAPARPFMRSMFLEHKREIAQAFAVAYAAVVEGKRDPEDATADVAALMAKLMRQRIDRSRSWAVPNAVSTIEKKGHSHPLIGGDIEKNVAGGSMKEAIGYAVLRNGTEVRTGK